MTLQELVRWHSRSCSSWLFQHSDCPVHFFRNTVVFPMLFAVHSCSTNVNFRIYTNRHHLICSSFTFILQRSFYRFISLFSFFSLNSKSDTTGAFFLIIDDPGGLRKHGSFYDTESRPTKTFSTPPRPPMFFLNFHSRLILPCFLSTHSILALTFSLLIRFFLLHNFF